MIFAGERLEFKASVERFARTRLLSTYRDRERVGRMEMDLVQEMGSLGYFGATISEALGGMDADSVTAGIVVEELARGDFSMSSVVIQAALTAAIIERNASDAIKQEWVPRIASGRSIVGLCVTEPPVGSDAANIQLRATPAGGDFLLNGEKTSITWAGCADSFIVFARTGTREEGAKGVTAFMVPRNASGLQVSVFDDLGCRSHERGSVFFDQVRVPAAMQIGDEGTGFTQVMRGFDFSRALIGLKCAGAASASLAECWQYVVERTAFGGSLAQFQGVTFPLADAQAKALATEQLAFHALELRDAGMPHTTESAMAKLIGTEFAFEALHQCILSQGHYGWARESLHQVRLQGVLGYAIADGAAGIMKLLVARQYTGRSKSRDAAKA